MSKEAFISELSAKLDRLSDDDRKDYLEFFSELIDDKIEEEGKSETDALEAMDSVCSIADEIIRQVPVEPDENARYIETHSVIDCTNRYRMDDGRYNFTVKLPEDENSYDGFNYYELTTLRFSETGLGLRLYLTYKGKSYMATDTSNKSCEKGNGYWLSA